MPLVDAVLKFVEVSVNITIDKASRKLEDKILDSDPPLCTFCDSVPVKAVYGCKDCKGLVMCTECEQAHLKVKFSGLKHNIFDLTESTDLICQRHGEHANVCCKQCHVRACALCAVIDHPGHDLITLTEGARDEREKLELLISEVQGLYDAKLAEATRNLANYTGDVAALKAELNELADRLIALINEKRVLALAEIDSKAAGPLARLRAEKAAVEGLVNRTRSCCRVAQRLLKEGSNEEIYELTPVSEFESW